MELTKKYIIKVYNGDDIIHTEEVKESAKGIEKAANTISEIVGVDYKILYEEDYDSRRRDRRQSEAARDPYTCTDSDNEEKCCRYAKTVTFRELGWHRWICFPTSFVSYECSGTCPTNHRVATEYSRIKSLMHDLDPTDWGPPCCAPTKLSPLWLMMFNSTGDLEFIEQPDMIVDECKCL